MGKPEADSPTPESGVTRPRSHDVAGDNWLDRRLFVGGGALALAAMPGAAPAQQGPDRPLQKGQRPPDAAKIRQLLAEFVVGFDLTTAPSEVIDRARIGFIDTIGVMLAGSRQDVAQIACEMVKLEGSAPSASVVGQSFRASPQLAALANGVAAHAMDYDFTYVSGQAVSAVIPAILPLAETTGASPREALAAFIVGCEVAARLVRTCFTFSLVGGWHSTGIVGVAAAAAAAARLLKLPVAQVAEVIGITTSLAGGISANFGTMTKPLHSGHAARDGIMAAQLGARGFTSHPAAFEAPAGYFNTFGRGLDVNYDPMDDLGQRFDLLSIGYSLKAYPCGGLTHTSIEAALALRESLSGRLDQIKAIHAFVTRNAGQRAGTQYPATVEGAKFSVAYLIAYAMVHGAPKIAAFTEHALEDERVRRLAATVSASVDPELGPGTGDSPARLRVTLASGQVLEQRHDYASGSPRNPMTQGQIEAKFLDCASPAVSPNAARRILAALNALPGLPSFDPVWPLLRRA
jgi:2-methylcitrate dehydratase PrpD